MSSATRSDASSARAATAATVEQFIEYLQASGQPIKSLTVVHDVVAGMIIGGVDSDGREVDHEQELAAGVTYVVVGLGRLPVSGFPQGITFLED